MARLPDATKFALCVAVGVANILKPILEFLDGVSPRSPVIDAAVTVVLVTLPVTYLMGVLLLQFHIAPAPAVRVPAELPDGASRRFACLACTMVSSVLAILAVALVAFWLLAGSSLQEADSDSWAYTPPT